MPMSPLNNKITDLMQGIINILTPILIIKALKILCHQVRQLRYPAIDKIFFAAEGQVQLV